MVLDFRPKDQPKPWYSRLGMRAISYAFLFVAVVSSLVFRELRKPEPFNWLVEGGVFKNDVVDTRVAPPPKAKPLTAEGEDVIRISTVDEPDETKSPEVEVGYFPGVKPGLLSDIQDGSPHRSGERDVYYHFMKILNDHEQASFSEYLKETGRNGPVAFAQLFRQPNHYRGHLVRVKARAHSCIERKFGKNPWGLDKYYHLYLESSEGHLLQANVLEIPDKFPRSTVNKEDREYTRFDESVELVGFFYKLIPYSSRDDVRNSPLLFAKTVGWTPPKATPDTTVTWTTLAGVLIGGMITGLTMAFVMTRQSALKSLKKKHGPPTQAEIAALGKLGETHRAEGDGSPDSAPADEAQGKNAPASSAPTNGVSASNGSTGHGPTSVPTSSGGGEASNTPQPT